MTNHTEEAFEAHIVDEMTSLSGWEQRPVSSYDRDSALMPGDLIGWLEATQPDACETLAERRGEGWREDVVRIVSRDLDKGWGRSLKLLREGKTIAGVDLRLAAFRPTSGINLDLVERYRANRLTVVRQVPVRKPDGAWGSVDLGLFVNGIPVASAELKNTLTGQIEDDAIAQYQADRDPSDVFLSRRCVVHFAVDPDSVSMTTRLTGKDTRFLPFNRGQDPDGLKSGAGNPPHEDPDAHKTAYLWRNVWGYDAWLDIIHRFMHVEADDDGEKVIFPRFHQWDAVVRMERHVLANGAGTNYLVQHSAGSGKSNTIGWLGHRLAFLHDAEDRKIFDKVIVITDRVVLNRQLQEKLKQFEPKRYAGAVVAVKGGATQLAAALESANARIVVTTLQTFPHVLDKVDELAGSRFAVLIDEAHSSQGGQTAGDLRAALSDKSGPEALEAAAEVDMAAEQAAAYQVERAVESYVEDRKRNPNLSMFAFTATPKDRTLELFGTPTGDTDEDGREILGPFHVYSMRQAIEEGFILDVLKNYTPYDVYWRVATEAGDEVVDRSKAAAAVARHASLHPAMMDQKAEIIVEHYREHVAHRIGGRAKAMVTTRSRLHAVRTKQAIDRYISEQGYTDVAALVAFSGKIFDPDLPGEQLTESKMNRFPDTQTPRKFEEEYQVMVVAEKYQTGYDQPLLHTMYVDKPLTSLNAVQTLGRLSRTHPEKEECFVLDFVNDPDDIRRAFDRYYETTLAVRTDPQALYETWDRVEEFRVVHDDDVDEFAAIWFTQDAIRDESNHSKLYAALKAARERFDDLDEDDREAFRKALKQYVRMYGFMSQMIDYADPDAAKRYAYGKLLLPRIAERRGDSIDLGDDLILTHRRIEKGATTSVQLKGSDEPLQAFPGGGLGQLSDDEQATLAEVVDALNERFGLNLGDSDKIHFVGWGERISDSRTIQQQAVANDKTSFRHPFKDALEDAVLDNLDVTNDLTKRFLDDQRFRGIVTRFLLDYTYRRAREKHDIPELPLGAEGAPQQDTTDV